MAPQPAGMGSKPPPRGHPAEQRQQRGEYNTGNSRTAEPSPQALGRRIGDRECSRPRRERQSCRAGDNGKQKPVTVPGVEEQGSRSGAAPPTAPASQVGRETRALVVV